MDANEPHPIKYLSFGSPLMDCIADVSKEFIESLDLEYNPLTTQIESHDILCILLSYIKVINNIIKD